MQLRDVNAAMRSTRRKTMHRAEIGRASAMPRPMMPNLDNYYDQRHVRCCSEVASASQLRKPRRSIVRQCHVRSARTLRRRCVVHPMAEAVDAPHPRYV